jgi:hypothetical protein
MECQGTVARMQEVLAPAERRARALCERDADALRALHHPDLRWTTHRGEVLDREAYIAGNVEGDLVWHSQRLEQVSVVADRDTAVLVGVVVDVVERDGERKTFRLRLTQTWVRSGGGWVCLAGHAGPVLA